LLLGLAFGVSSCGSPATTNYRLAAIPGPALNIAHVAIAVRSIGIPGFLDNNAIPKPGSAYQANSFSNAAWAEPLGDMLQTVLTGDLAQRLPGTAVFNDGAIGTPASIVIEADVQRFDFDPDSTINLTVQFALHASAPDSGWKTASFHAAVSPGGTDPEAIVAAMSRLWGQAADQLAQMIIQSQP